MARETQEERAQRARAILRELKRARPDARIELEFSNPLELLVATVLAAQCTDKKVNEVTRTLFKRYPTAAHYAKADPGKLEQEIRATGFYHQKAKSLVEIGKELAEKHGGDVPRSMSDLVVLPGVARKTANVVLGSAMGIAAGIVVDTHVQRLAGRTGLSREKTPEKIEADLMELLPKREWIACGVLGTLHGRNICIARRPWCSRCVILALCPQAGVADAQ
ncbi:MAG: endonuclease III [Armatimonadota bacterium]|nr:MAG: endonuclease III [Armatimonadota bacterium]